MSEFVEQCLREWKRLGVPDPLAEEMAADMESDLSEAEAEGVRPMSSSVAASSIHVRSRPPGQPNAGSSPTRRAEETSAAGRSSSWRSLRWPRSHCLFRRCCSPTGEPKLSLVRVGLQDHTSLRSGRRLT